MAVNTYELVLANTRRIESLLENGLGGVGRGLYEKAVSVEHRLTPQLLDRMLFIATVRNALTHDQRLPDDPQAFADACAQVIAELERLAPLAALVARAKRLLRALQTHSRRGLKILVVIVMLWAFVFTGARCVWDGLTSKSSAAASSMPAGAA